jgi:hypothetical protein
VTITSFPELEGSFDISFTGLLLLLLLLSFKTISFLELSESLHEKHPNYMLIKV